MIGKGGTIISGIRRESGAQVLVNDDVSLLCFDGLQVIAVDRCRRACPKRLGWRN